MNAMLLSMPGSPVVYYGDDRDGRKHYIGDAMAYAHPCNGASIATQAFREQIRSGCICGCHDPIYGYQAVNVEAQES